MPYNRPATRVAFMAGVLGGVLFAVGAIVFLDVFITFDRPSSFGVFGPGTLDPEDVPIGQTFGGIALMVVGALLFKAGAGVGAVGNGRRFARWLGSLIVDEEIAADSEGPQPVVIVKVRCRQCKALNDETAQRCEQCGAPL